MKKILLLISICCFGFQFDVIAAPAKTKNNVTFSKVIKVTIPKDKTSQNLVQVMSQARMEPYTQNDQTIGYQISQIEKGSIYEDLKLKDNDIINRVNGVETTSLQSAMPLLLLLKTEKYYTVDITRTGIKKIIEVTIK